MRIAFSAPPTPGHLNPTTSLARKLRDRGHDVVFIGIPDAERPVRAAGVNFLPFCQDLCPPGDLARHLHQLSLLSGSEAWKYTFALSAEGCRAALDDGPRALRDSGVDACVLDTAVRGFDLAAMHLGIPYIHLSNGLHFDFSGYSPLCVYDWPHEATPEARARNLKGVELYRSFLSSVLKMQRAWGEPRGLELDWDAPNPAISRLAWLTQAVREFDFPGDHHPKNFHYTGPLNDGFEGVGNDFPWERLTGEPLIYASMGTLQNGNEKVFRTIAEAAGVPGLQLVLALGNNVTPERVGPVAQNTIVVNFAPQIQVLRRAALCITHAGLNTTLGALSCGVPMVAIPVSSDQPGVAARIAYTGTGLVVPVKELTVERLRAAVNLVIADPRYRENAGRLRQAISRTNGLELAADLIERALVRGETK
jgi:zeaxanthin glucosyltransferase